MTPNHFKSVVKDIEKNAEGKHPICAFLLRCGVVYTGTWQLLTPAANVLVVSLVNKEAPPIYLSVVAIDAVAVDGTL